MPAVSPKDDRGSSLAPRQTGAASRAPRSPIFLAAAAQALRLHSFRGLLGVAKAMLRRRAA